MTVKRDDKLTARRMLAGNPCCSSAAHRPEAHTGSVHQGADILAELGEVPT